MKTTFFKRACALVALSFASSWAISCAAASVVVGGKNFTEQ
ncbi:MAG: glycine/betaine ABC transporter substrate-binding protein, partial [Burkholderia sp.]|nr:glycine/betaine ABC transporter substrate-binding protein [Burkholderia sp.]